MANEFRSTPRGYHTRIDRNESRLLQELCDDVVTLLEEDAEQRAAGGEEAHPHTGQMWALTGIDPAEFSDLMSEFGDTPSAMPASEQYRPAPTDQAVKALLPSGSADDSDAHGFRARHEENLRLQKIADLRQAQIYFTGRDIYLNDDEALVVLRVLNHLRLTLAARLDIKDESDTEHIHQINDSSKAVDARSYMALIYNFLTWWQDTLSEALLMDLPEGQE